MLPSRDHSLALPVRPGSLGDGFVTPLEESPRCASDQEMHLYVKGCGSVPCGLILSRWGSLGVRSAMTYAAATSRNVLLEESLCIFCIALLPSTPSIYLRIDGASTGKAPAWADFSGGGCGRMTAILNQREPDHVREVSATIEPQPNLNGAAGT
jgi:hypothetical protein